MFHWYSFLLALAWLFAVLGTIGLVCGDPPKEGWSQASIVFTLCCWAFVIAHYIA